MLSSTKQCEREQCRTMGSGTVKCRAKPHEAKQCKRRQSGAIQSDAKSSITKQHIPIPSKALILSIAVRNLNSGNRFRSPITGIKIAGIPNTGIHGQEFKPKNASPAPKLRNASPVVQAQQQISAQESKSRSLSPDIQTRDPHPRLQTQASQLKLSKPPEKLCGERHTH